MPTKPTSPPNPSSIHQVESIQSVGSVGSVASIHSKKSNIPYWSCPHCTPSLTLPPSSLKCLQKSNPNIHRKCFRCFKCFGCFRCFRCFISLLDYKIAPFWSKSELNPQTAEIAPPPYNGCGKHPKRQFTSLHAKGVFLPASGIDPSLARATKPAPQLVIHFHATKATTRSRFKWKSRGKRDEELGCGFGKSGKSSNFAVQNINIV